MKQGNRHDDAMIPFEINQNSFQTRQRVTLDSNSLSELEIGPRFRAQSRRNNRLNGGNLTVLNWEWDSAAANDRNYARRDENR